LRDLHQAAPLRILFPQPEPGEPPLAALLNCAGGLAGGDQLEQSIKLEAGATATLSTAAAEKVYRSLGANVTARTQVSVAADAVLEWLPQEAILFDGARLDRHTRVDVAPGLGAATALAVMRALFGDAARMADAQRLVTSFTAFEGAVMGVDLAYLFGLPPRFSGFQFHSAWRHARDVRRICSDAMAIAEPGGILGALRAAQKEDGAPLLDETQLISEVAMMLLAGSETSANALSWALYLVARHPPTLARLREEHASVLGGRAPTAEELNKLPFTRAVLQETMRLYPPVPYLSRQAAGPDRIRHIAVQKGDTVLALPWLLHRHERLWDAPHAFRPDRVRGIVFRCHAGVAAMGLRDSGGAGRGSL
jgi:cytochrome P450